MSGARCEGLGRGVVKPREMDRWMDKRGTRMDKWRSETEGQREREKEMREMKEERGDAIRLITAVWSDGRTDGRADGRAGGRMDGRTDGWLQQKTRKKKHERRETGDGRWEMTGM